MLAWIVFLVLAFGLLAGGVLAIRSTDLVHSVLWLAVVLVTTAAVYVVLHADFIAAAQLLLYTGGVITLMLFAVMLTKRVGGGAILHGSRAPYRGIGVFIAVVVLVGYAIAISVPFGKPAPPLSVDTKGLGALFLTRLMLPFELLSILLLAAMMGAIVLARREAGARPAPLKRKGPPIKDLPSEGHAAQGGSR